LYSSKDTFMIRVLLVDDQALFLEGLANLLSLEEDLEIVGQAYDGQEAIALTSKLQPDVILMDVRMPICDGVKATREIHKSYPAIKIMVLTTFNEDQYIWRSLQAGALGYLLKNTPSQQIAAAIRTLYQGHCQLDSTVAAKVFAQMNPPARLNVAARKNIRTSLSEEAFPLLSDHELEILKLLGQGQNNREIAQTLYLTEGTIKNYITNIFCQLGVRDRTQAALWAKQNLS
jgi:DNA-binding NarL/FixJ family response regulator